jgi:hypothetical protein
MDNGELPDRMDAWVFWLVLGTDDLVRGGCSEEATLLGILSVGTTLSERFPFSVVVIEAILPRTTREDGVLDRDALWESIQAINAELAHFCEQHENFVYLDMGAFYYERSNDGSLSLNGFSDGVHLSAAGYMVYYSAILKAYACIVIEEDMANDIDGPEVDSVCPPEHLRLR